MKTDYITFHPSPPRTPDDLAPRSIGRVTQRGMAAIMALSGEHIATLQGSLSDDRPAQMNRLNRKLKSAASVAATIIDYFEGNYGAMEEHETTAMLDVRHPGHAGFSAAPRSPKWHMDSVDVHPSLCYFIGSPVARFNLEYTTALCPPLIGTDGEAIDPTYLGEATAHLAPFDVVEMFSTTLHRTSPHFPQLDASWCLGRIHPARALPQFAPAISALRKSC